ncbi:hypothetical protein V2J09_004033 [Rumex salicifolius]
MEKAKSQSEEISSAKAVLLGALAPGVNDQTWSTLKIAFLMLGLCLLTMLSLAFSSSDSIMVLHVALLVLITLTLFFLLSRFLEQTGFVTIEHQMREIGLMPEEEIKSVKSE